MKKTIFLKTLFTVLLCGCFSMSYGADWYISSTGSDSSGDGLTTGTAWASFSKAQTAAASGDIIHVSGMIDFWSDPANITGTLIAAGVNSTTNKTGIVLAKSLTIQGTSSATDGFQGTNGSNSTRFIQINGNYTLTLKNLKLANGAVATPYTTVTTGGGAISMGLGAIVAENVIFDGNTALGHNGLTGGAIFMGGTNADTLFKNCVFSNNAGDKIGAVCINNWAASSTIKFEGCSFISNKSNLIFGGSALFIRSANDNNSLSLINCTVANNKVLSAQPGGAIYVYKGSANTTVNIVNCTITENTTVATYTNSAGVYMLNTAGQYLGKLNISNSIIEGNTAASSMYADFNTSTTPPTTATLQINNSIIGRYGASSVLPAGCVGATNYFNYLTGTSVPADLIAKLAAFNSTNNSYPLQSTSPAINYGASSYLSSLSPAVNTDQLGNVRSFTSGLCSAGSIEFSILGLKETLANSISVYRNANNQIMVMNPNYDYTGAITIYNTIGQVILRTPVTGAITTIDKSLNSGVYIVTLNNAGVIYTKKVIIN